MRALVVFVSLAVVSSASADPSLVLNHTGRLLDDKDQPVTGTANLVFELHTGPAPGGTDKVAWTDTFASVPLSAAGIYTVLLGDTSTAAGANHVALTSETFTDDRWLAITVNGIQLNPWLRVGAVAFAVRAGDATAVGGQKLADLDARYAQLGATAPQAGTLSVTGDVTVGGKVSGKFFGDGSGLTGIADGALSANVALLGASQTFTGTPTFNNVTIGNATISGTATGKFVGDGSGLTGIADGALPANVALLGASQTFSGTPTFNNVTLGNATISGTATGKFVGDGSGLTGIADGALSHNVALLSANNAFTGANTFSGADTALSLRATARSRLNLATTSQGGWQLEVADATPGSNQPGGALGFTESGVAGGRLVLAKGGNVGVGTVTPAQRLDVNGNVNVSGWIQANHAPSEFVQEFTTDHCTALDSATYMHIRTSIDADNIWEPKIVEVKGFHSYLGEWFHDFKAIVNTPDAGGGAPGAFNYVISMNSGNDVPVFYRTTAAFNGARRVAFVVRKLGCCCIGRIWVKIYHGSGGSDSTPWDKIGSTSTSPVW